MATGQHTAPGQAAGYLYQLERALHWLAKSQADSLVGIETADDVTVVLGDGRVVLEQDKHSVQQTISPFGDRDRSLWKTLSIWAQGVTSGAIDLDRTHFYMVTNRSIPECIARDIRNITDDGAAALCLDKLRKAAENPPESIATYVTPVLALDEPTLKQLLRNIQVLDEADCVAGDALRADIVSCLFLRNGEDATLILNNLVGWVFESVISSWRNGQPAWIARTSFSNALGEIRDRLQRQRRRERNEALVPVVEGEIAPHRTRIFVEQIRLVSDEEDDIEDAIRTFLRAEKERFRLSQEGEITREDWHSFFDRLRTRWKLLWKRHSVFRRSAEPKNVGKTILFETLEHRESLAGQPTEEYYLTGGSYHLLADVLDVGWHPDFYNRLTAKKGP